MLAFFTLLLFHRSLSAQSASASHYVGLTAFMIYDMTLLQSLNVFYAPKKVFLFDYNNFHAF